MNQYIEVVAMTLATGVVTGLGMVAADPPPRDWEGAMIGGGIAAASTLLATLRSLHAAPPGQRLVREDGQ